MLKLKYLFENYDLAKEALKNWEHDGELFDQFRISSNAIYPFSQNGGICFLRLAPEGEKLEQNVFGEIEFINYLLSHQYPALKPLPAISGETCLKLKTAWGNYYASAFQRVSGVPLERTDLSGEIMYQYGNSLGKLHSLSSNFKPVIKKWTHAESLNWIENVLTEYHAPDAVVSALSALKRDLEKLPQTKENYGLVHYDFELDNVFYDESTKTCSVIDFDDGMYHWYALDIVQVFDALEDDSESLTGEALKEAKREFIRGYCEEHSYPADMEALQPLMLRFIDLYGYARLIRCVAEQFPEEPEWLVTLREKLKVVILKKEAKLAGR